MAQCAGLVPSSSDGFLRLVACPRCAGRRRGLVEAGGVLIGHCLRCGETLGAPLEVEVAGTAPRVRLLAEAGSQG